MTERQKYFGSEGHSAAILANPDFTTNQTHPWASFYNEERLGLHKNYDDALQAVQKRLQE